MFQSVVDLHPGQLLIDESRWPSVCPAIPMFQSYWQLQSWVFLCGPGSFVSKGLIQNLGTVSHWTNAPSWNPSCHDGQGFRQSDWDIINVMHQCFPRIPPNDLCLEQDLPDPPHWYQLPIRCHKEYLWWLCNPSTIWYWWSTSCTHSISSRVYSPSWHSIPALWFSDEVYTQMLLHIIYFEVLSRPPLHCKLLYMLINSFVTSFWWYSCSVTSVFWYQCDIVTIIT